MSGLIGKKVGMTSFFDEKGNNIPCTVLTVGPCVVSQVKTEETDGYKAIQLAYDDKKEKRSNKAETGHFAKCNTTPKRRIVEFREFDLEVKLGDTVDVGIFKENSFVDITAVSKGKGFQGVVKRHGFSGVGMRSHGQHNRERAPGSIGAASFPSRVFKGMRMAGRMGGKKVTVQNLEIVKVLADKGLIIVRGAVPGHNNSYLTIYN